MSNMTYEIIADNSTGLHLVVFENDDVIYCHHGYEAAHGALAEDIAALMSGEDPRNWDGCSEDPKKDYEEMSGDFRYKVVADGAVGGEITTYPERMGGTALDEMEGYLPADWRGGK